MIGMGWVLAAALGFGVQDGAAAKEIKETQASVEVISPIFHQLVAFNSPADFVLHVPEHATATFYRRETVLKGETVDHWTQMLTVTGAKGAAAVEGMSPAKMGGEIAEGFQKACPETYAVRPIGAMEVSGLPGYLELVSCGTVAEEEGGKHSEAALIVVIAGDQDFYTVQWAERGEASATAMRFDDAKWQERFQALNPIRVCAYMKAEKAPYPSCLAR